MERSMMTRFSWALALCLGALSAHADPLPAAVPAPGAPEAVAAAQPPQPPMAPDFALEGTSGQTRRLRDYRGRVVILIYEDRDSNQQNNDLKRELAERARAENLTRDVAVVPVANLSSYSFWPASGFARDAVVDIARQQGMEILIDWSNSMSGAYRFRPSTSYVMVLGRDGRVLFRHAGALPLRARMRFFSVIGEAIASPG
jgi:hypothetical protein